MPVQEKMTRRLWLIIQVMMARGGDWFLAVEAVDSTALAHPEWDMAEERTWAEWEKEKAPNPS